MQAAFERSWRAHHEARPGIGSSLYLVSHGNALLRPVKRVVRHALEWENGVEAAGDTVRSNAIASSDVDGLVVVKEAGKFFHPIARDEAQPEDDED